MRQFRFWGLLLLVPALALFVVVPGCKKDEKKATDTKESKDDDDKDDDGGGTATDGKERTELKTTGWGTLKGAVTLDGKVPQPKPEDIKGTDAKICEAGLPEERLKQGWKVRKSDKRVANVVVWIQPLESKYFFKLPPKDEWPDEWKNPVVIDQPHCAFVPHVAVAWPKYYDPKKKDLAASGQKFEIHNSASVTHNTKMAGNPRYNSPKNNTLPPKKGGKPTVKVVPINPDPGKISLICDIHKWMNGYVWAFDHPYADVTKGDHTEDRDEDKSFGTYEIKMVPTGQEVRLFAWHEEAGFITPKEGIKIKLKKGDDNVHDFSIKK
jgi:hypothetical protein